MMMSPADCGYQHTMITRACNNKGLCSEERKRGEDADVLSPLQRGHARDDHRFQPTCLATNAAKPSIHPWKKSTLFGPKVPSSVMSSGVKRM